MIHTHPYAVTNGLSREVHMIAHSKEDNLFKVHVSISNGVRKETCYYFIDGTAHVSQAVMAAVDRATEIFLGLEPVVAKAVLDKIEAAIPQASETQGADNGESIKEGGEEVVVKKERKKRESKQQEKLQVTEPPKEEMEEVESPYKEDSSSSPESEKKSEGKTKKSTAETYNREDKTSKASFASFATRLHKGDKSWKENPKLKEISTSLHGLPFIEKDGSVVPEFEAKCRELFGLDDEPAL